MDNDKYSKTQGGIWVPHNVDTGIESRLVDVETHIAKYSTELEKLQEVQKTQQEIRQDILSLKHEISDMRLEIKNQGEDLADQKIENEEKRDKLICLVKSIEKAAVDLTATVNLHAQKLYEIGNILDSNDRKIADIVSATNTHRGRLDNYEEAIVDGINRMAKLEKSIGSLRKEVKAWEDAIRAQKAAFDKVIKQVKVEFKSTKAATKELDTAVKTLEISIESQLKMLTNVKHVVDDHENLLGALRAVFNQTGFNPGPTIPPNNGPKDPLKELFHNIH